MKNAALLGLLIGGINGQGTDLGGGILTRTNVERYADIALDIRDISDFLEANNGEAALAVYREGRNAELQPGIKFTLQKMTTDLGKLARTAQTPNYLYQLYGLADRNVATDTLDPNYADNFAATRIRPGSKVAAEGLIALHSWMYATHVLYHGVDICRKLTIADNRDLFDLAGGGMDEFIATWIGKDQQLGSSDGHGLYAMTQRAGELFGKVNANSPEAPVNTQLKLLYQEGASALVVPNACTRDNVDAVATLWTISQLMISQMAVPLMQMLIDSVIRHDAESIATFALAIVPQTAQCRPSSYKRLKEALLDGTKAISQSEEIIRDLQSVYECLGISCRDIGAYRNDQLPECLDPAVNTPLAEYSPSTLVRNVSN